MLNPVDIAAPRWKRIWLDTNVAACEVHGITLEQFPAAIARRARNMDRLLILVSKYRQKLQIA
ncbi:hypothetical protein YK56LOC_69350 [Caballeronia sp. HLA56]